MLLVAMCMGAGLGNDAALVRARDVEVDDNGVVWLNVEHFRGPYFAPKVPMARTFAKDFMSIVDKKSRHTDEPLLGYATRKDYVTGRLNEGQSFHVNASRLRATWAVEIIDKAPFLVASSALGKKSFPRFVESLKKRERDKYTPLTAISTSCSTPSVTGRPLQPATRQRSLFASALTMTLRKKP